MSTHFFSSFQTPNDCRKVSSIDQILHLSLLIIFIHHHEKKNKNDELILTSNVKTCFESTEKAKLGIKICKKC